MSSRHFHSTLPKLAKNSKDDANLYVFVTGKKNFNGILGVAYSGTVCRRETAKENFRVSINRYGIPGSQKNKVLYTAEVNIFLNS